MNRNPPTLHWISAIVLVVVYLVGNARIAAETPRPRKPWEAATPTPTQGPTAVQKAADGTVWNLFSGFAKGQQVEPWQGSWSAFARDVEAMYAHGAKRDEFVRRYNGKQVVWEGEVEKIEQLSKEGPRVRFRMPNERVRLPDGQSYALNQLMLTLRNGSPIPAEKKVRIRTTLADGSDPAVSSISLPGESMRVIVVSTKGVSELVQ